EDQRIGRIMERLTPEDLLLVVSDHGSAPCHHHIAVNRWLIDQGYLVLKKDEKGASRSGFLGSLAKFAVNLYRQSSWIRQLAKPFRRTSLRDVVVHTHFAQRSQGRLPLDALPIDWARTTAYYLGDDRLYLNVAGREPSGSILLENYESKRAELCAALKNASDPETGKRLFANVFPREEIYRGPYLEQAPDLILVPGDVHWNLGGAVGSRVVDRPVVGGKHHPEGVFLAWGAGVQAGARIQASIYDITPTILHSLGLPIPADADGTPQLSWFTPATPIAQTPVKTAEYSEVNFKDYQWSLSEEKQVEARLRDLGYLD
ncbi:MAG TPA: alkaline phosphatase family protein, partial [Anaerolineales bacterium]|nr:alkaline phosphatase family protein [Anaerolineales bacterium]